MLVMIKSRKNYFPSHLGENVMSRVHTSTFHLWVCTDEELSPTAKATN